MTNKKQILIVILMPISILSLIVYFISLMIYFQNNHGNKSIEINKPEIIKNQVIKSNKKIKELAIDQDNSIVNANIKNENISELDRK